jgi:hypothetical protein
VHTVNMEQELIEHVRCRPLLYDPPIGNIGIKMFGRKQPFRVHSYPNNDDDTTTALHSGQNSNKPDQT